MLGTIFTFIFFLLDQGSKFWMEALLQNHSISVIPNFFELEIVYNTGASFSILSNQTYFLIGISFLCLIALQLFKKSIEDSKLKIISFALLYGGIVGNLLDRIVYHHVRDFLKFNIFGYQFPVFNLADTEIVCGVILLIIILWKEEKKNAKNHSRIFRQNKN